MLLSLINILVMLANILWMFVVVQFVLSLLISFNVVNMSNNFVETIWRAVNVVLDPVLNPIRRLLPNTGGVDFSPMVLLIGIWIAIELLKGVGRDFAIAQYY